MSQSLQVCSSLAAGARSPSLVSLAPSLSGAIQHRTVFPSRPDIWYGLIEVRLGQEHPKGIAVSDQVDQFEIYCAP